jgi:probable rRNA maturation factor
MDPADSGLRVLTADEQGRSVRVNGLAAWLRRVAPATARGTVSIALVSDARMRALNRTYRRKDYATDVLSFAENGVRPLLSPRIKRGRTPLSDFLGEVVIARGVAKRQAREAGHSEDTELRILALHGLLHLLGYDHERDNGRMRRVEARLRRKGGLAAGLIERAGRTFTEREGANGKIRSVSDGRRAGKGPRQTLTKRESVNGKIRSVSDGKRAASGSRARTFH